MDGSGIVGKSNRVRKRKGLGVGEVMGSDALLRAVVEGAVGGG
jgi:hypothetical protein